MHVHVGHVSNDSKGGTVYHRVVPDWNPASGLAVPDWNPASALAVPAWNPASALAVPDWNPALQLAVPAWNPALQLALLLLVSGSVFGGPSKLAPPTAGCGSTLPPQHHYPHHACPCLKPGPKSRHTCEKEIPADIHVCICTCCHNPVLNFNCNCMICTAEESIFIFDGTALDSCSCTANRLSNFSA